MSKRKAQRITRTRTSGGKQRKKKAGRGRKKGRGRKEASYGGPPAYDSLDQVPWDLLRRAETQKLPWIRAYVQRGRPRGMLIELAEAYAVLNDLPASTIPPRSTLYHWARRYEKWGLLGLVDSVRSDAGTSASITPEVEEHLRTYFTAVGRISTAAAIRHLSEHCDVDPLPSYDAVRHWGNDFAARNPDLLSISKDGVIGYRNRFEPYIRGDLPLGGDRLGIDSTVADVWIRVPCPIDPLGWKAVRPALTVVECVGSRSLITFGLSLVAVNPDLMLAYLRRSLVQETNWRGLVSVPVPREVVTDAGSEHRGAMEAAIRDLKVTHRGRRANRPKDNARAERLIQTVQLEVFTHLTGYSKTEKVFDPYTADEADAKRSLSSLQYDPPRMEVHPESLLTLRELEAKILGWGISYNQRAHPSLCPNDPDVRAALSLAGFHTRARDVAA
jgi:transposase InsO family protein